MGERYIKQVNRKLKLSRSRRKEIIHDLEELFAEATACGETEEKVIERLGTPEEYARECLTNLQDEIEKVKKFRNRIILMIVTFVIAFVCMFPYISVHLHNVPADAIGYADAGTGIYLVEKSGIFNEYVLFGVGILLVIIDVILMFISINKSRKGD